MGDFAPQANDKILRLVKIDEETGDSEYIDLWRTIELNPEFGVPLLSVNECPGDCEFNVGIDLKNNQITFCSRCWYYEKGAKLMGGKCQ